MITREEYNKALDIVEAYHKQLFKDSLRNLRGSKDLGKTHLRDWKEYGKCSRRLRNVLHFAFYSPRAFAENIEDIDIKELGRCRNAGEKTLLEFQEIRGY